MYNRCKKYIILFSLILFDIFAQDTYYLKMAIKAHQEKEYTLSNQQLEKFLKAFPEDKNIDYAYLLFASNLIKLKDFNEAEKKLNFLIEHYPDSFLLKDAFTYLILLYLETERFYDSYNTYKKYIEKFGKDENLETQIFQKIFYNATYLFNSGELEKSKEFFSFLIDTFPEHKNIGDIYYYTGIIFYNENQFQKAEEYFKKAILKTPNKNFLLDLYLKLGDCYFNIGNLEFAEKFYLKVISEPNNLPYKDWAYFQYAILKEKREEYSEAEEIFEKLIKENKEEKIKVMSLVETGKLKMIKEKWEEAEEFFLEITKNYPKSKYFQEALLQLGFINFNKNDIEKAICFFEKLLTSSPEENLKSPCYFGLGYCYYKKGDIDKASSIWSKILNTSVESKFTPEILFLLGKKYFEKGNYQLAEKYLQRAINFPDTGFFNISYLILVESLIQQGKLKEGKKLCEDFLNKYSGEEIKLLYGKILYFLKEYEKGKKFLEEISATNPKYKAESLFYLGKIHQELGNKTEAKEKFLEILTFYEDITEWSGPARENLKKIQ